MKKLLLLLHSLKKRLCAPAIRHIIQNSKFKIQNFYKLPVLPPVFHIRLLARKFKIQNPKFKILQTQCLCAFSSPLKKLSAFAPLCLCAFLSFAFVGEASVNIYVDCNRPDDSGNGLTEATAKKTLSAGLALAKVDDGQEYFVITAPGTYSGADNKNLSFDGYGIKLSSTGAAATTIIDCENSGRAFYFGWGSANGAEINGFTIRNGLVNDYFGGALCVMNDCQLSMKNCVFENNKSDLGWSGGAIFAYYSPVTFENCEFRGNVSTGSCGAVYQSGGNVSYINCGFDDNKTDTYCDGGAVYCINGDVSLSDCIFNNNYAWCGGSVIIMNSVSSSISRCEFKDNMAGHGGGLYLWNIQNLDISNCLFVNNRATYFGGAIAHFGGDPTTVNILNTTIVSNIADNCGDGLYTSSPTVFNIKNSIVWNHIYNAGATFNVSYSCAMDSLEGAGNISANPQLTPSGWLKSGSPCIDAGTSDGAPADDLYGQTRPNGAGVDIGCDEYTDSDNDGLPDWYEIENNLNPSNPSDASGDADGDSLNNLDEYLHGTMASIADSDGDGVSDGNEVTLESNPVRKTVFFYVDDANGDDGNDGSSLSNAKKTLSAGIALAKINNTGEYFVMVAAGTYIGADNKNLSFDGCGVKLRSIGGAASTIIDCEDSGRAFYLDWGGADEALIRGFTIKNCCAGDYYGGAMRLMNNCRISLKDCIFENDKSDLGWCGGAVMAFFSEVKMENCEFRGNSSALGGAIYIYGGNVKLDDCVFTENSATSSSGGAVYIYYNALVSFTRCRFEDNSSGSIGGAVNVEVANADFIQCVFKNNTAVHGGALGASGTDSVNVVNCVILGNHASVFGGGLVNLCGDTGINILNSTIAFNEADNSGDGIYASFPAVFNIKNSIIWNKIIPGDSTLNVSYSDTMDEISGTGNFSADPKITLEGYLTASSPCIDIGTSDGAPSFDVFGQNRPSGNGYDIGAVEFIDSDNDGLADTWEIAYFGDLSHDGNSDSDGDGYSDSEEFAAGTDPAESNGETFHTVTFTAGTGGSLTGELTQSVRDGADASSVTAVATAGYYFLGWTGDLSGFDNPLTLKNVTSNMTITANFAQNPQRLFAMGCNCYGQLGDGTTTIRYTPVPIASGVTAISAGYYHSLFLKEDASLWAMGGNYCGQLGDGTTTAPHSPVQIASGVTAISAGYSHSLFLKNDSSLWAMGNNYYGQLGDGTTTDRHTPVQIASGVTAISTRGYHSLFLKEGGSLWGMGYNGVGQLGDGTTTIRYIPIPIASGVTAISAGNSHSLFLKNDGSFWGMGWNKEGQLGDETTIRYTPVQIASGVTAISAGNFHSLFLKENGSMWAMGWNDDGQLGDGTTTDRHSPVQIASGVTAISAGVFHSLFIGNGINLDMIPDWNRDGVIDDDDTGKVTPEKPWRFWINDNNDISAVEGQDYPNGGQEDCLVNSKVDGIRDFIDFFPVRVNIKKALEACPADKYDYVLKNDDGAFNAFIATGLTASQASFFLTDKDFCETNAEHELQNIDSEGYVLPLDFLNKIKNEEKDLILLEACSATSKPLVLEIRSKSEGKVICKTEMPVSISEINNMFRHKNLREVAGGDAGNVSDRLDDPENYPDSETNGKNIVFIHGYNNTWSEAYGTECAVFKRLFWSGSKAKFHGITWRGDDSRFILPSPLDITPNYHLNVLHAFETASAVKDYINILNGEVAVAGHSLGNMLASAAISLHGANVKTYFIIDGAVAKEAFNQGEPKQWDMQRVEWDDYYDKTASDAGSDSDSLFASEWYRLFSGDSSDPRGKLTWRGIFKDMNNATCYDFYSSGEDVLNNTPHANGNLTLWDDIFTDDGDIRNYTWGCQEKLKGMMLASGFVGSNYAGWGFNKKSLFSDYGYGSWDLTHLFWTKEPPANALLIPSEQLKTNPFFYASPSDLFSTNEQTAKDAASGMKRFEILSKAIPARSFAIGRNPISKTGFTSSDMMGMKDGPDKNWWPSIRDNGRWFHSDFKNVAYLYTHKVYNEIVNLGGLK